MEEFASFLEVFESVLLKLEEVSEEPPPPRARFNRVRNGMLEERGRIRGRGACWLDVSEGGY